MSPARKKASGETKTCPWCSAVVPVEAQTCPSCGASLGDAPEGDLPGLTQIDPAAVIRPKRIRAPKLAAFLGVGDDSEGESSGKVEPPTEAVKREMLRLELAALNAELDMKASQAAAQQALPPEDPGKAELG